MSSAPRPVPLKSEVPSVFVDVGRRVRDRLPLTSPVKSCENQLPARVRTRPFRSPESPRLICETFLRSR